LAARIASPAGFVFVASCFLMPFVAVSCTPDVGVKARMTYSGTELIAGSRPDLWVNDRFGPMLQKLSTTYGGQGGPVDPRSLLLPIVPQALMAAVLEIVVAGMVLSVVLRPWGRALASVGTALCAAILLGGAEQIALHAARTRFETNFGIAVSQADIRGNVQAFAPDMHITIATRFGFWLAMGALAVLAVGNIVALVRLSRVAPPTPDTG
jgi:hypothetical protein